MMRVDCCMKKNVISIKVSATVADAAELFRNHHVGMLPVLDDDGCLVGILQLGNLLQLIMPAFVDIMGDLDYVGDFGAMEHRGPAQEELDKPIAEVMEAPISVQENSGLVRAFTFIYKNNLLDLPVVNGDNLLVGLASRVDIGRALLTAGWQTRSNNHTS